MPMYLSCSVRLTRTVLRWKRFVSFAVIRFLEQIVRELQPLLRHRLQLGRRGLEAHRDDGIAPQGGHLAESSFMNEVRGLDARARGEDAVEQRRAAAALDVADDGRARLDLGLRLDEL